VQLYHQAAESNSAGYHTRLGDLGRDEIFTCHIT